MAKRFSEYHLNASERPIYMYEYYVTGSGQFPFDMLRFDLCWPATGDDAALMENPIEWREIRYGERKLRSIKMRSYKEPTIARGSSFTWSVGNERL